MIEWTFANSKTGERIAAYQSADTMAEYDRSAREAQRLANKLQVGIACTAWKHDCEGATIYRYPKKRGRPAKPDALTNAARQAAYRERKKAQGICPCCGQALP